MNNNFFDEIKKSRYYLENDKQKLKIISILYLICWISIPASLVLGAFLNQWFWLIAILLWLPLSHLSQKKEEYKNGINYLKRQIKSDEYYLGEATEEDIGYKDFCEKIKERLG